MENGPQIDDYFPIEHGDIFQCYVSLPEGIPRTFRPPVGYTPRFAWRNWKHSWPRRNGNWRWILPRVGGSDGRGVYMGVSKNRGGPPKWMVKIMENLIKIDDLGVPPFKETPI